MILSDLRGSMNSITKLCHYFSGFDIKQDVDRIREGKNDPDTAAQSVRFRADLPTTLAKQDEELLRTELADLFRDPSAVEDLSKILTTPKGEEPRTRYEQPIIKSLTNDDKTNIKTLTSLADHAVSIRTQTQSWNGYLYPKGRGFYLLSVAHPDNPLRVLMTENPLPNISDLRNAQLVDYGTCT